MKVLLLSRYSRMGASSRVRLFQYLPYLESKGWQVTQNLLFSDDYLKSLYSSKSRGTQVFTGYWRRLKALIQTRKYDLIWIEKEIFPFLPAIAESLLSTINMPYIVDYDDALFHRYDQHRLWLIRTLLGSKIDSVMRNAALVIAGNEYIAERAQTAGARRIEIVPTVVDLSRYKVIHSLNNHLLTIGWIGSPATSHYLSIIAPILASLIRDCNVRIVAIGANPETLKDLPIEVWHWSEETEVQSIQDFDIGIMPLIDSPWERGKCGYKLIQYMACGLPVVASPIGVNKQIIRHGVNGFLAQESDEWEQALRQLLDDQVLRQCMGAKGREQIEAWYSLQIQAPRLAVLMSGMLR